MANKKRPNTDFVKERLEDYLDKKVFADAKSSTLAPDPETVAGFNAYMEDFKKLVKIETAAVELI